MGKPVGSPVGRKDESLVTSVFLLLLDTESGEDRTIVKLKKEEKVGNRLSES